MPKNINSHMIMLDYIGKRVKKTKQHWRFLYTAITKPTDCIRQNNEALIRKAKFAISTDTINSEYRNIKTRSSEW